MDKQTFLVLYEDVCRFVSERRMSDALNALRGLISFFEDGELMAEWANVREAYRMLLDYMEKGYEDPDRHALLGQFFRRVLEMAFVLRRRFEVEKADSQYALTWRTLQRMGGAKEVRALRPSQPEAFSYRLLFDLVWTSPAWRKEDVAAAQALLSSSEVVVRDKCVLLSAMTLAALHFFDKEKVLLLMDGLEHANLGCRTRALVGLVLVGMKHSDVLRLYPDLSARMSLLADNPRLVADLQSLQILFFLTLDTRKIERSLQEDIIPEMMKKAKSLRVDKKLGFDFSRDGLSELDLNPEWDADGHDSALADKIRQIMEKQQEGADIFIGSFKLFKQKFPFFTIAANWLCPFDTGHPEIARALSENPFIGQFLASGSLCDSDKYSFCLMYAAMPSVQRDLLNRQLAATMPEGGLPTDRPELSAKEEAFRCMSTYVHDLYRFFKFYAGRDERLDPFKLNLLLTDYPAFRALLSDATVLREVADFAFKDKLYPQALRLYGMLGPDAETCQKMGYCHQQAKEYGRAVEAYERSNLFCSDSAWTLRQLGFCCRMDGNVERAIGFYEEAERLQPDDTGLMLRLGECYMHVGRYDDAFRKFYKVNYLDADSLVSVRAIAWCSLLAGKYDEAARHYAKIMEAGPTATDCLNAGHVAWLDGKVGEAVRLYRRAFALAGDKVTPAGLLADDAEMLRQRGKSTEELNLMMDILNGDMRL